MNDFATQKLNIDKLILQALAEDITSEDITTNAIIREPKRGKVNLICKEDGILSGLDVYKRVFELIDDTAVIETNFKDGDSVKVGDLIAVLEADVRAILSGERVALNYLQRMSGVATHTNRIVKMLEGSKTVLLDTRKTTPNNRIFEVANIFAASSETKASPLIRILFDDSSFSFFAFANILAASIPVRIPWCSATYDIPITASKLILSTVFPLLIKWNGASIWVPLCAHIQNDVKLYKSPFFIELRVFFSGFGSPGYTWQLKTSCEIS